MPRLKGRSKSKADVLEASPQLDLFGGSVTAQSISSRAAPELMDIAVPPPVRSEPPGPRIYSVAELSQKLRDELRDRFGEVMVRGEVADFKGIHRSGHLYFGLKDANAQIRAVMWKGALQKVPFEIKAGLEVICTGRLDYYAGSGSLQVVVERMEPVGIGALQLKFEQLKEKLRSEGLFEAARKRPVSPINWRIGLVTSKTGAALQDMLRIYRQRFPMVQIYLFHAAVQGANAPGEIAAGIECANRFSEECVRRGLKCFDVLVVGRGGGSYEDLFCFNDERVARAIVASKIPVVSAVGHEIDITIADMVADKRSATPSHAAQETVPEARLWLERLQEIRERFEFRAMDRIADLRQSLDDRHARLLSHAPHRRLQLSRDQLQQRRARLENLILQRIEERRSRLGRLAGVMDALSPLKVLERGYAVPRGKTGTLLRSVKDATPGTEFSLQLSDGQVNAKVL